MTYRTPPPKSDRPPSPPRGVLLSAGEVVSAREGKPFTLYRPVRLPCFRPSGTPGYDWTFRGRAGCRTEAGHRRVPGGCWQDLRHADLVQLCPIGPPGGELWGREGVYIAPPGFGDADLCNRIDDEGRPRTVGYAASMDADSVRCADDYGVRLTPSVHMPRWASRLHLRVARVDITPHGAVPDAWAWAATVEPAARPVQHPGA